MPKRWSTKDPIIADPPTANREGVAVFRFTDDYSVFHYSKMPDQIPGKGAAMANMAGATLRMLSDAGLKTHLLGFKPPDGLHVRFLRIIDPAEYRLKPDDRCRLIPLQVICRNLLPQGASMFRRLESGAMTPADIGLMDVPLPGQPLPHPVIEFTTKLEEIDRFISPGEAQDIAGLDDRQFSRVKEITLEVNRLVTDHAASVGLVHADSKIELGIDEAGEVIVVDTAGTLDENRFLRNGVHVSKQVLRNFYLPLGLEEEIQGWVAEQRPRETWPQPPHLDPDLISLASMLYLSMAERWTGQRIWGAEELDTVVDRLTAYTRTHSAGPSNGPNTPRRESTA